MSMEHWWSYTAGENGVAWRQTCFTVTLPTTNATWIDLGLNLDFCAEGQQQSLGTTKLITLTYHRNSSKHTLQAYSLELPY